MELGFLETAEPTKRYEYVVLATTLQDEVLTIAQHYRDRADAENVFDELKNQWGWGGYTTRDLKRCCFMARIVALVYNWWTLFVRLAHPDKHLEAITSRPLLLLRSPRRRAIKDRPRLPLRARTGSLKKFKLYSITSPDSSIPR